VSREKMMKEIEESMAGYPDGRAALLSALHTAQYGEGWLTQDSLQAIADKLNLPPAMVKGVATFYALYRHKPTGKYLIQLCTNVACMIMGAESFLDVLKREFGLEPGGTSEDGRFSLIVMECIGACGTAPAMLVNDDFHENVATGEQLLGILKGYK